MNYQYNKTPINLDRLKQEIETSAIVTALNYLSAEAGITSIYFKTSLSLDDKAILDAIVLEHSGEPLVDIVPPREVTLAMQEKTPNGYLKVSTYEPEGDAASIVSINYGDASSWFQFSLPKVKEPLSLHSGEGIPENTFKGTKPFWIDLFHGRLYDEDNVVAENPGKYDVKIYVDDVLVPSNSYVIDYPLGSITFNSPVSGTVTASYYYADKSYYALRPRPGKMLAIKRAEVQFSEGTIISSPFVFEAWFNHPQAGWVPVPGSAIAYKNAKDFISACNEGQGLIPPFDGLPATHVFPFDYARPKPIKYSQNVEIRVYCRNHQPLNTKFATVTFYVSIDNEV